MLARMAMRNYASFAPSGKSGRKKVRASPALPRTADPRAIPSAPPVTALADEGDLGVKACGRVPVAQLDSSSGFLIRRSQVRVLPGTPLLTQTWKCVCRVYVAAMLGRKITQFVKRLGELFRPRCRTVRAQLQRSSRARLRAGTPILSVGT